MTNLNSSVYKHYKGNLYIIREFDVLHTEDETKQIIYSNLITHKTYCRPQYMFYEKVSDDQPRFSKIAEDILNHRDYMTDFCVAYELNLFSKNQLLLEDLLRGEGWSPFNSLSLKDLENVYKNYFSLFEAGEVNDKVSILTFLGKVMSYNSYNLIESKIKQFVNL